MVEVDIFATVARLKSWRGEIVAVALLSVLNMGGRSIKLLGGWRNGGT